MNAHAPSVLIGFADALAAPEVAASLIGGGYRVVSFARRGRPSSLKWLQTVRIVEVTPPETDLDTCLEEVARVAASCDVVMPLNDPAVYICDRALDAGAALAGPRGAQAAFTLDKRLQAHAARAAGLAVPQWSEPAPGEPAPADIGWPLVMKPALALEAVDGHVRRLSPRVVNSPSEMAGIWQTWGESTAVMLQRWTRGVGAGIFGLADESGAGHISAHRRVRMMNPEGSGSSACISARPPAELLAPVERFLALAEWQGLFMVELLRGDDGTHWFMELNGRPWGSLALSRRLGFEYPAWAAARALDPGAALPEPPPFKEMLCRNLGREIVHLSFVLRGPRSPAQSWPGRWATVRALARHPRGSTWYNLGPGLGRVFLYDAWRTVADQIWAWQR